MEQIPTEVMEKIEELYIPVKSSDYKTVEDYEIACSARQELRFAAQYGYRLASPCALCEGKEKEIAELKGKINELTMDNMTHEYNKAEAEKYAPEYKRQIEEPLLEKLEELKAENKRLKGLLSKIVGSMVLERVERFDLNDEAKALI